MPAFVVECDLVILTVCVVGDDPAPKKLCPLVADHLLNFPLPREPVKNLASHRAANAAPPIFAHDEKLGDGALAARHRIGNSSPPLPPENTPCHPLLPSLSSTNFC